MLKRDWSDILQAQRDSGLRIEAFCRSGGSAAKTAGLTPLGHGQKVLCFDQMSVA